MIKLTSLLLFLTIINVSQASDFESSPKDYYDYLTQKTVEDFHKGIKRYNENKPAGAPLIKRVAAQNYSILVKSTRIKFTLLNYLNDQMYINGQLVRRSTFGLKKTSWINFFILDATASEDELDAETTKILLTALGSLQNNLEEVGMMCFLGCENDVKKNNRKKVMATINQQHADCDEQLNDQEMTIKKYRSYKMVSLLHSTFDPEFQSVKKLIQQISESNIKKVNEFMQNKMLITKDYKTCVGVMTSGTAADNAYGAAEKGISILASGGRASMVVEEEIDKAKDICAKMDELKTCLLTLKENLNTINTIKRNANKDGYDFPLEKLPDLKAISK